MSKSFSPGPALQSDDTPAGCALAEADFAPFVKSADAAGVQIILDAPLNHSAPDIELATFGQQAWGGAPTDQIRNTEARFFSRGGEYDMRAFTWLASRTLPVETTSGSSPM